MAAVAILDKNVAEEVGHVRAGVRWFRKLCDNGGLDPQREFLHLARSFYKGALKKPFNVALRSAAELPEAWYLPLAAEEAQER